MQRCATATIGQFRQLHSFVGKSTNKEIQIRVPWGYVAGKWWGPTNQRPIVCLHGWQDNCSSFDRLIPLLNPEKHSYLTLDLVGHGHSSKLPKGLFIHNIYNLVIIECLVNHFGWNRLSLMGHSMGAILSFLYTILNPEKVDVLVCLDALKPFVHEITLPAISKKLAKFLELKDYENVEPPSYSLDEIKRRLTASKSIDDLHSHLLVERGTRVSKTNDDRLYFSRDVRWKTLILNEWQQDELITLSNNVICPIFIAKALESTYFEEMENFYAILDLLKKKSKECVYAKYEGTHHFHLNNPEVFAKDVNTFIERHHQHDVQDIDKSIFVK